jgi:hypothetical protein
MAPVPIVRKHNSTALNDNLDPDALVTERRDPNAFNDGSTTNMKHLHTPVSSSLQTSM